MSALSFPSSYNLCPAANNNKYFSFISFEISLPKEITLKTAELFAKAQPAPPAHNIEKGEIGPQQALIGPLLISKAEVIGDLTGHVQQQFDSSNIIFSTKNEAALAALGLTSSFNVFLGGLSVKNGYSEAKTAHKVSDVASKHLACLKIGKGSAQAANGLVSTPVRILQIASLATSSKVDAMAAGVLGIASQFFGGLQGIIAGVILGTRLRETYYFRKGVKDILADASLSEEARYAKSFEHLKSLATLTAEEKEKVRKEHGSKAPEEEKNLLARKEASFSRCAGSALLAAVRAKGAAEAKAVVDDVLGASKKNMIIFSIELGLAASGIGLLLASGIPGWIALVAIASLNLAVSFGWLLVDLYQLVQCFKESDPGRFDKLCIFISTVLAIAAISLAISLSGGTAGIVAAAIVGTIWLTVNIACYVHIHQLEKKSKLAAASLNPQ